MKINYSLSLKFFLLKPTIMNHFKLFLKQFFSNSFTLIWIPFIIVPEFISEEEPTFWNYFFTIGSTSAIIILVVVDIFAFRKTLKN